MKRNIKVLLMKLLAITIPIICLWIVFLCAFSSTPMRFFDGEYASYQQNREYAEGHTEYCRVLIMGDSVSKSGWVPKELPDDTYNFSLGGATMIEEYYCLREYLEHNEAPEYVIYSQNVIHFMDIDCFWSRGVYFHRLGPADVFDVYLQQKALEGSGGLFENNKLLAIPLYCTYSPIYYSSAFLEGTLASRQAVNMEQYKKMVESRGRIQYRQRDSADITVSRFAKFSSFECIDLVDLYFRRIIELCDEHHIRFVYQSVPVTTITYEALDGDMLSEYHAYLQGIQRDYPNAVIDGKLFSYDTDLFSDGDHLAWEGSVKYTREMREKYDYIFDENV